MKARTLSRVNSYNNEIKSKSVYASVSNCCWFFEHDLKHKFRKVSKIKKKAAFRETSLVITIKNIKMCLSSTYAVDYVGFIIKIPTFYTAFPNVYVTHVLCFLKQRLLRVFLVKMILMVYPFESHIFLGSPH